MPRLRLLYAPLALLFAVAAAVQVNDTEPLRWIALYTAAAVLCALVAFNRAVPRTLIGLVIAIAAAAAGYLGVQYFTGSDLTPMHGQTLSDNPTLVETEEGREMVGAAVVALLLLPLLWLAPNSRATARPQHGTHDPDA
jgi:hypothetical protein